MVASGVEISEDEFPELEAVSAIQRGLHAFNQEMGGPYDREPVTVLARIDSDVKGGLLGLTYWNWMFIDWLWMAPDMRGHGIGGDVARSRGGHRAGARLHRRLHRHLRLPGAELLDTPRLCGVRASRRDAARPQPYLVPQETMSGRGEETAMKAAVVTENGVQVRDVPEPKPSPEQVLVRVRASGLNRADLAVAAGHAHGSIGGAGTVVGHGVRGRGGRGRRRGAPVRRREAGRSRDVLGRGGLRRAGGGGLGPGVAGAGPQHGLGAGGDACPSPCRPCTTPWSRTAASERARAC